MARNHEHSTEHYAHETRANEIKDNGCKGDDDGDENDDENATEEDEKMKEGGSRTRSAACTVQRPGA